MWNRAAWPVAAALALMADGAVAQHCSDPDGDPNWGTLTSFFADDSAPLTARPELRGRLERMAAAFADLYPRPEEGSAETHTGAVVGDPEIEGGPWSYELEGDFLPRLCDPRTGQLDALDDIVDRGLHTAIYVNSVHAVLREREGLTIDGRPVYSLGIETGTLGGRTVFAADGSGSGRAMLFTHGGLSPLRIVTRAEYLSAARASIESEAGESASGMDEVATTLRQQLEEARAMPEGELRDQLIAGFEQALNDIASERPVSDTRLNAAVAEEVGLIDSYLSSRSAGELAEPAYMYEYSTFQSGDFPSPAEEGVYRVVQLDETYFDSGQLPGVAQLVVFVWEWRDEAAVPEEWRASVEAKFPLEALAALIGH